MELDPIEHTEAWQAFEEMRKAKGKRAPFTPLARKRILFELRRFQADGHNIDEILWTSATNGWSGVFPIRRKEWRQDVSAITVPAKLQTKVTEQKEVIPPERWQFIRSKMEQVRAKIISKA